MVKTMFPISVATEKSRLSAAHNVARDTAIKWLTSTTAKKVRNWEALESNPHMK